MAIVGVQQPEYRDKLADLAKMMNIAQSVFGIVTDAEVGKIRREQAKQEAIKTREMDMNERYKQQGIMTEEELNNSVPAEPGSAGSRWKFIRESVVDESGNRVKNPDGTDKVNLKPHFYYPKGYLEGEKIKRELKKEELALAENVAASKGTYTPRTLMDPSMVSTYSFEPKKGYRAAKLNEGGVEKPVWVLTPSDIQSKNIEADNLRAQEQLRLSQASSARDTELHNVKMDQINEKIAIEEKRKQDEQAALRMRPPLVLSQDTLKGYGMLNMPTAPVSGGGKVDASKMTADEKDGYLNAIQNGVQNPTREDIRNYNTKKIEMDRDKLGVRTRQNSMSSVVGLLTEIDTRIGGIDSNKKIPGVGPEYSAANLPAVGGLVGNFTLNDTEATNRQLLGRLRDILLRMQSGASVTDNEWKRAAESLAADAFANTNKVRSALQMTRDLAKRELGAIESSFAKPSIDAFKSSSDAIHSGLPVLQKKESTIKTKKFSPDATIEEKMDQM